MTQKTYVPVDDITQLEPGELVRVVEEYEQASATYEGPFKSTKRNIIFIDSGPNTELSAWMSAEDVGGLENVTIEREVTLPSTRGSAVLIFLPVHAKEFVVVLDLKAPGQTGLAWLHPTLGPCTEESVLTNFVRVLWEA